MERNVRKLPMIPERPKSKKVAAYARVSCGKDAMLHSLSAQISYYSSLIQNHAGWDYAGVYADEALTGTKDNRAEFQRLLTACRAGEVDVIITKSISRFARNTVTLLETVRELKLLGIDVYFEEQNIHTMSGEGELMLTILASFAQEESLSASENQKWRIKKNFEEGKPWNVVLYGYSFEHGKFEVVPEERSIVKRIFKEYLAGYGCELIAKRLNEDGLRTRGGFKWSFETIARMLKNYSYTGNLILQKTFRENHITKKTMKNNGERAMYQALETHEAIVSMDEYNKVQEELRVRAERFKTDNGHDGHIFTGKIVCSCCGKNYRRKTTAKRAVWICSTFNTLGKAACGSSRQIPETVLLGLVSNILGVNFVNKEMVESCISRIVAEPNNVLRFCFTDGRTESVSWEPPSRRDSWTEEMKETARQRSIEQRRNERCQKR